MLPVEDPTYLLQKKLLLGKKFSYKFLFLESYLYGGLQSYLCLSRWSCVDKLLAHPSYIIPSSIKWFVLKIK